MEHIGSNSPPSRIFNNIGLTQPFSMDERKAENATSDGSLPSTTSKRLLEDLRNVTPTMAVVHPTTKDEAKEKMKLIIENRLWFPARLREAITRASRSSSKTNSKDLEEPSPERFLSEVYEAFKFFFFGKQVVSNDNDGENDDSIENNNAGPFSWWHGLNSDVDTEEEAELAIRLFPNILMEKQKISALSSMNDCYPIYILLVCSKSLPFIPLLAELGVELGSGRFVNNERGGLTCFMRNVIFNLIHNNVLRDDLDKEASSPEKLDELSAVVMARLKEKGLMKVMDIYEFDLLEMLLYWSAKKRREAKQRFRVLINCNPSILVECERGGNLLRNYLHDFLSSTDGCESKERVSLPTFRMIFQLGISHFPNELGFVFHGTNFELSCKIFGTETVTRIVNDELTNNRREEKKKDNDENTMQDLLFAAADNDEISIDGVYTLLRLDPIAMLQDSYD